MGAIWLATLRLYVTYLLVIASNSWSWPVMVYGMWFQIRYPATCLCVCLVRKLLFTPSLQEAVNIVLPFFHQACQRKDAIDVLAEEAAKQLTKTALERRSFDNVSAIILFFFHSNTDKSFSTWIMKLLLEACVDALSRLADSLHAG